MKITLDLLKKMPPGPWVYEDEEEDGLEWFLLNYPEGSDLWELWQNIPREDWKIWLALNLLPTEAVFKYVLRMVLQVKNSDRDMVSYWVLRMTDTVDNSTVLHATENISYIIYGERCTGQINWLEKELRVYLGGVL